jgi:hypothetical protein
MYSTYTSGLKIHLPCTQAKIRINIGILITNEINNKSLGEKMHIIGKPLQQLFFIFILSILIASCVTETTEAPSIKFNEASVISVSDPGASILVGSTFAWLPEAVRFYKDKRLDDVHIKTLIEAEIKNNIKNKGLVFVESASGSSYSIAYTAALESSLDDSEIINRFGLLPGMASTPKGDEDIEKGSLIIYVFNNKSGDVIWRSAAQVGVEFNMSDEQRKQRVIRVVAEMFQSLPVRN